MVKKVTVTDSINNVSSDEIFKPQIAVLGIGGAGANAVNNMIHMDISGVKFIAINTDAQSLENSVAPHKIQIGPKVTRGLGAGSKPEIGTQAAEESIDEIKAALEGINMLVIAAGMGGGTGTGASTVIARLAKDLGILSLGFVTKPFAFEGLQRQDIATKGTEELEKYIDALVVLSNQSLFKVINTKTSVTDAFRVTDNILYSGVRAITDLITSNGLVNLDFNDIKSVLEDMGRTMLGSFEANGEDRAIKVAEGCISNPLLEDETIRGAQRVLINISGGQDMTLYEVDTIVSTIRNELEPDAFIHFGTSEDPSLGDNIRVCIIATGLPKYDPNSEVTSFYRDNIKDYGNKLYKDLPNKEIQVEKTDTKKNTTSSEKQIYNVPKEESNNVESTKLKDVKSHNSSRSYSHSHVEDEEKNSYGVHNARSSNFEDQNEHFLYVSSKSTEKKESNNKFIKENVGTLKDTSKHTKLEEDDEEDYTYNRTEEDINKNTIKLFDLITKPKTPKHKNYDQNINDHKITQEKSSKLESELIKKTDNSFFDFPSFLSKKKS